MAKPLDTRARLLKTAADLIWQSSYHSVGVERICEQSGTNKGSFYHYFASKEELALAAIDEQWRELKPRMDEIFSAATPPLERLRRYARESLRIQTAKREETGFVCGCPLYALGSEVGTQSPHLRAKVAELLDTRYRYFEALVRDAKACGAIEVADTERSAHVLLDLVEGALTRARITDSLAPIESLEQALLLVLGAPKAQKVRAASARKSH